MIEEFCILFLVLLSCLVFLLILLSWGGWDMGVYKFNDGKATGES